MGDLFVKGVFEIVWETIGHAVFVTEDEKASNAFLKPCNRLFRGLTCGHPWTLFCTWEPFFSKSVRLVLMTLKASPRDGYMRAQKMEQCK